MQIPFPDIPEADRTPLVRQLLEIIHLQQDRIRQLEDQVRLQQDRIQQLQERVHQLEDEIARLKGLKARPRIAPSSLETPPRSPRDPQAKRPGSAKRPKTAQLTITDEVVIPLADRPEGAVFKGYEDFVVQDLVLQPRVIRYRREHWRTPDGQSLVAPLPVEVVPGSHFGPDLICFILHQYHHQHVTQPLLLEQLHQLGIDISAGELCRILTEGKDAFHQEKDDLLPAALAVSAYVEVDDTGARHRGHTGACTQIGNELFASFASTDSKSRLNFLEALRGPHTDYVINEIALAYWQRQGLSAAVVDRLVRGPQSFADPAAWQARLQQLGITGPRPVRIASEGALLGSLIAHGVSPELVILSDGAGQYDVLAHAACWIHAERPLARMIPYSEEHRAAITKVRGQIWELDQDLKRYRRRPEPSRRQDLESRFDALCGQRTGFPSVDGVLKGMREHRSALLRVLERPEVPLHTNLSERHLRDYVTKRKISGGTRSEWGRRARDTFASLKKTCRELGVNFWAYLQDRVRGAGQIPRLAELIRQKAEETAARKAGAALPA
jgi:Transposase IS66 family